MNDIEFTPPQDWRAARFYEARTDMMRAWMTLAAHMRDDDQIKRLADETITTMRNCMDAVR